VSQRIERRDEARSEGELLVQQVGLPVRVLCGVVAAAIFSVGILLSIVDHGPGRWASAVTLTVMATPFGFLAAYGWRAPIVDPAASKRFLELADPKRPLTPDDFVTGAAEREPQPRSGSAAFPSAAEAE
jgi:hypothetical protein